MENSLEQRVCSRKFCFQVKLGSKASINIIYNFLMNIYRLEENVTKPWSLSSFKNLNGLICFKSLKNVTQILLQSTNLLIFEMSCRCKVFASCRQRINPRRWVQYEGRPMAQSKAVPRKVAADIEAGPQPSRAILQRQLSPTSAGTSGGRTYKKTKYITLQISSFT